MTITNPEEGLHEAFRQYMDLVDEYVTLVLPDDEIERRLVALYKDIREQATHACGTCHLPAGRVGGEVRHWGDRCGQPRLLPILGWTTQGEPVFWTVPAGEVPDRSIPLWE